MARAIPTVVYHRRSVRVSVGARTASEGRRCHSTACALKSTYGTIRLSVSLHPLCCYQAYSFRWSYFDDTSIVDNEMFWRLFWEGFRVLVYIRYTTMVSTVFGC
jgi:hypothetical protein